MKLNKIIAIALVATLVLSLCVGCKSNEDLSSSSLDDTVDSNVVYGDVDIVDDEASNVVSNDSDVDSDNDASDSSSSSEETIFNSDNYVSVGDGGSSGNSTSEDDLPPTYIESAPTTSNPDKNAPLSTVDNPLQTNPNAKGKVVTVEIKAGTVEYYKIGRVSNKVLTINSPNAYVVYEGVKYTAKNGVLSFEVVSELLASEQIPFQIGNSGSKAESFTIWFIDPVGSKENPEPLTSNSGKFTTTINLGRTSEYFYKYTATNKGKIRFYLLSDEKTTLLSVGQLLLELKDVEVKGYSDVIEETSYLKTAKDSTGIFIEFDTNNGDEFKISVAAKENTSSSGTITIEWKIVV